MALEKKKDQDDGEGYVWSLWNDQMEARGS